MTMLPDTSRAASSPILVVGPSWVGDMVMAQSLFMMLRATRPNCLIDVLAPGWSLPLLERMPEVRAGIDMPLGHGQLQLGARYRLGRLLHDQHYHQAIVLPNSLKSALVPWWAKIPLRTGYVGELRYGLLNDARRLHKQALRMTVQRFVALGLERGAPLPDPIPSPRLAISERGVQAALAHHGLNLNHNQPMLALCPGAEYGPAKRWPEEYYAELAREYLGRGWRVWLFGSHKDREVCAAINAKAGGGCVDLAGKTSLGEAIDLMSLAGMVVSNDSGLMHVAASLRKPLMAIYGSSDPGFTPPLNEQARVLSLGLECSPCFKRECPLGHLNCLRELKPAAVLQSMRELEQAGT